LRPLFDGNLAPRFEAATRRVDRAIDVFAGAARNAADFTARSTSSAVPRGTRATSCSVADEITGIVSLPVEACHAPS
jgi:hypothetical protein